MIYKCPNCFAALEYNPEYNKMECSSCGSMFEVGELNEKQDMRDSDQQPAPTTFTVRNSEPSYSSNEGITAFRVKDAGEGTKEVVEEEGERVECNIYSCTTCGAELAINGVEASTFCAYCGQPTIVFSRVSNELMPESIIPFKIQKDEAVHLIRQKLSKGFFVPKDIRNFEVERVCGIYVPFWLIDMYYHDSQYLKGTVRSGKTSHTYTYLREAETTFKNLTADASEQLSDESSQRLEPYFMTDIVPFDIGYMSGFYSDRYDVDKYDAGRVAYFRAKSLFDEQMKKSVNASDVKIIQSRPDYEIQKTSYVMLPVWFMTFRRKGEPYTILVNGQTGKVIGAVPFVKEKVIALFALIAAASSVLVTLLSRLMLPAMLEEIDDTGKLFILIIAGIVAMYGVGLKCFADVKRSIELTKAKATNRFVKDRQEDI